MASAIDQFIQVCTTFFLSQDPELNLPTSSPSVSLDLALLLDTCFPAPLAHSLYLAARLFDLYRHPQVSACLLFCGSPEDGIHCGALLYHHIPAV
jgi:hypothetical protein